MHVHGMYSQQTGWPTIGKETGGAVIIIIVINGRSVPNLITAAGTIVIVSTAIIFIIVSITTIHISVPVISILIRITTRIAGDEC